MSLRQSFSNVCLAAACMASVAVHADANLVSNPSFEAGAFVNQGNQTMVLNVGSTIITGWTVSADQLAWIDTGNPWGLSAQEGNRFLDLTAYPAGAPFGGVSQDLSTVPGTQYELSFQLGSYTRRWGGPPISITASAGSASRTFTVSTTSDASTWTPFSMLFTATAASTPLTLVGSAGREYIGLDSVSVEEAGGSPVPEPGSLGLLLTGAALFAARRLKR